jgi:hypothetical protein
LLVMIDFCCAFFPLPSFSSTGPTICLGYTHKSE